ncbi:hypothetical protein Tco_1234631 [Tanacetum coccineum]
MEIRIKEIERPEGLDFENLAPSMMELLSKTLTSFAMLAMNRMIGALFLKLRIALWGKEKYDHEIVHRGSWSRPINYNPTQYVINITTSANYDTRHPPSYTSIRNPIRRLVHHLLTLSVAGRHSGKEKVTLDDLFLLHSMDGGVSVDVLWHVAKFLSDKVKGSKRKIPIMGAHLIGKIASYYGLMTLRSLMNVTLGPETSSMSVAKLVDLGICRYNGLGIGEMVVEIPEVAGDDDVGAGQAEIGGVGRHPNMSNANRLKAMDERLGEIVNDVDELTYVVWGCLSSMTSSTKSLDSGELSRRGSFHGTLITF